MLDLITSLTRKRGIATFLVTHDRDHLETVDAITAMRDGRVSEVLDPGPA